MALVSGIVALGFLVGMAMLFGWIANHAFKRSSPRRRAAYAAAALGVLLTIPAFAALLAADAAFVSIASVAVGTVLLAALAFPLALVMTRRQPGEPDHQVFD